jgi:hypothetical protein
MANPSKLLTLPLLALSLAAFEPGAAFADGVEEARPPVSAAPPPVTRANEPGPCIGNAPVGQVVAVSGTASSGGRGLACDDPLRACEDLVTGPGSSIAFLSGDVLVRVGPDSRVAMDGAEGAPKLFLHDGSVRSTDGRAAGAAPVRLVTRDLAASASGADAELSTGGGKPAQLCAFEGSALVEAGASSRSLPAGQCFAAQDRGIASFAAAAPSLGLEAPGFCAFDVALDDSLAPGDVAAPPLDVFPGGDPVDDVPRDPCDEPGAGCSGRGLSGDLFDDPDPVPGCDAPGVDCGGGGQPGKGDDVFDDPDPVPGLDVGKPGKPGKGGKGRD